MQLAGRTLSRLTGRMHSVALVGVDGSGKSTQAELLDSGLVRRKKRIVLIHPFGRKLLAFLPSVLPSPAPALGYGTERRPGLRRAAACLEILDLAIYVWAAYAWCFALTLWGRREVWLISDRSFDDLLIKYRYLKTFSPAALARLRRLAPQAEKTIWLKTDPEVAMKRDREFEAHYYQEIHADYLTSAGEHGWLIVSTSTRSPAAIAAEIAGLLNLAASPAPAAPVAADSKELGVTPGA